MSKVVAPSIKAKSFSCLWCGALADQHWHGLDASLIAGPPPPGESVNIEKLALTLGGASQEAIDQMPIKFKFGSLTTISQHRVKHVNSLWISECHSCKDLTLWVLDRPIYPNERSGPQPHDDMPPNIKADFEEARTIVDLSPRGAAALLRLCIQNLCKHLKQPGDNINTDIGELVKLGLPSAVANALDAIRVMGNLAVHPGELDLRDDRDTVLKLFDLVNFIVQRMIADPQQVAKLYSMIPPDKMDGIVVRDKAKPETK